MENRNQDMVLESELATTLQSITADVPADGFFLENSKEHELAYVEKSVIRWLDILTRIHRLGLNGVCLDIGTSPFTFALRRLHVFDEVDTLDYTAAFKSRCEHENVAHFVGGEGWTQGQDCDLAPSHYDCILLLEVIEHMHSNPEQTIAFLRSRLRPGGCLILSTPNLMCLGNRIRMLLNRKLLHFTYPPFASNETPEHGYQHDRIYMPSEMHDYFENTGWTSFEVGYHSILVSDGDLHLSPLARACRYPLRLLKKMFPALRQIMVISAIR